MASPKVAKNHNCYRFHILVEHPELIDVTSIADTIASPDLITHDVIVPQRLVYYRTSQVQPQRWLKVVVEQGKVVTAYRVRRLQQGETKRWPR